MEIRHAPYDLRARRDSRSALFGTPTTGAARQSKIGSSFVMF